MVFVSLDFVEKKDAAVSGRKLLDRADECETVNGSRQVRVDAPIFALWGVGIRRSGLVQRHLLVSLAAKVHENSIHRHAV